MRKFSVNKVSKDVKLSVSRIYKICKRADLGRFDSDLGIFVLYQNEVDFIKSRKGQRGKKL